MTSRSCSRSRSVPVPARPVPPGRASSSLKVRNQEPCGPPSDSVRQTGVIHQRAQQSDALWQGQREHRDVSRHLRHETSSLIRIGAKTFAAIINVSQRWHDVLGHALCRPQARFAGSRFLPRLREAPVARSHAPCPHCGATIQAPERTVHYSGGNWTQPACSICRSSSATSATGSLEGAAPTASILCVALPATRSKVGGHQSDPRRHHRIIENRYHGLDRGSLCAPKQIHGISTSLSDDLVHLFDEPRLPQQIVNRIRILTKLPGQICVPVAPVAYR